MADPSPAVDEASPSSSTTAITDLNEDAVAHCALNLSLQDISNMAMSCKLFKHVAYSDSVWQRLFREQWPQVLVSGSLPTVRVREAYLARRIALLQFKFVDPLDVCFYSVAKPHDHILLDNNDIFSTQGSSIQNIKIDNFLSESYYRATLSDHKARITCMRLFPLHETSLFRSEPQRTENVLVTSSCDHSIRLWWKGSCQRCFKGHNGPVSTLSDKLLGDGSGKILASGGEDATVRLWSLSSSGKRGQQALKATLYGHEKPIKLMSVAGHKSFLLVTISKDSKVRVWDTSTSSAVRSSCCVGMTSVPGVPVDMKCHESMLYIASGSSVVTIDLRTMQKVMTPAICKPILHSFSIMPSKSLICTGGIGKAMTWDIRRSQDAVKPQPMAELDGHVGSVTQLHMDPYKIVTGGRDDLRVNIWETDTGMLANSLLCDYPEEADISTGCSAMAVSGCRIVTASYGEPGLLQFRDFSNATCPVLKHEVQNDSKFWGPQCYSDTDCSDG